MLAWVCRVGVHFPYIRFSHIAPPLPDFLSALVKGDVAFILLWSRWHK